MKINEFISRLNKECRIESNLRAIVGGAGPSAWSDGRRDYINEFDETFFEDGDKICDNVSSSNSSGHMSDDAQFSN